MRHARHQEQLTTIERELAPLLTVGRMIPPPLVLEILNTPALRWPRQFSTLWEPTAGGPVYELAAETAAEPSHHGDALLADLRSVTLRIEGSRDRRSNDWRGFRIRLSGVALHRRAILLVDHDLPIVLLGGDDVLVVLWLRDIGIFHDDVSTAHGYVDWTVPSPEYEVIEDGPRPPTAGERKLIERGGMLLARFTTTMTTRGKPGSGISQEQRQAHARQRLIEGGRELQQRTMKIGRRELMTPLMVTSVDGVADILRNAGWTLDELRKELNSTHTT